MSKARRLMELLKQSKFTDSDLEEIGDMPAVRELAFRKGASFEKPALRHLARNRRLKFLSFSRTTLDATDLAHIAKAQGLLRLNLEHCHLPPAGLSKLLALPKLTDLWLESANVSDRDLASIGNLQGLKWLILSGTDVTDAGIQHLRNLRRLETLWLQRTRVSATCLDTLASLPRLKLVDSLFKGTSVTKADLEMAFEKRLSATRTSKPARSRDSTDSHDLRDAEGALKRFFKAMHDCEAKYAPKVFADDDTAFHDYEAEYAHLLSEHCTKKRRAYTRSGGISMSPRYDPLNEQIKETRQIRAGRVEIRTHHKGPPPNGGQQYAYVILKQGGQWRVDGVKRSSGGPFEPTLL